MIEVVWRFFFLNICYSLKKKEMITAIPIKSHFKMWQQIQIYVSSSQIYYLECLWGTILQKAWENVVCHQEKLLIKLHMRFQFIL